MICEEAYHQQPQIQKEQMTTMMMMDQRSNNHQRKRSPLSSPSSPSSPSASPKSPSFNNEEERLEVVNLSGMALESLPNPSLNLAQICKLDLSNNHLQVYF